MNATSLAAHDSLAAPVDVSFIVVSFNTADLIGTCIRSIQAINDLRKEIFIVDNASTDGSADFIRQSFPFVSFLANETNKGFAAANNQVISSCRGRYIFFLNPDTRIESISLSPLTDFMDANPQIGIAGVRILNPDGSIQESVSYRYPGEKYSRFELNGLKGQIACVLGAGMIARSELIRRIGGFDEDFFLYGEDQDICLRIRRLGYEVGYFDQLAITHFGGQSERDSKLAAVWRKKSHAEYIFYRKHYLPETIRKINRKNLLQARWRLSTISLVFPFSQKKSEMRQKLIKYQVLHDTACSQINLDKLETIRKKGIQKVSVIICFYNKIEYLKRCLDSLRFCKKDFDEVVIADDGSDEPVTRELKRIIPDYDFPIVHAWHERSGARRAACRNNGIRHATGDYLVFIDSDFLILPGTVRAHVLSAKPGWFVAGRCKYLPERDSEAVFKNKITPEFLTRLYDSLPESPIRKEHWRFIRSSLVLNLGITNKMSEAPFGGHFSAYRCDIEFINGYDENYVGWGGEDLDLALRLAKIGIHGASAILNAKAIHVWHPKELGNKHWKEGPNIEYYLRENIPFYCENGLRKRKLKEVKEP